MKGHMNEVEWVRINTNLYGGFIQITCRENWYYEWVGRVANEHEYVWRVAAKSAYEGSHMKGSIKLWMKLNSSELTWRDMWWDGHVGLHMKGIMNELEWERINTNLYGGFIQITCREIDFMNGLEGLWMNMNMYEGLLWRVLMNGFLRRDLWIDTNGHVGIWMNT